MNNIAKIVFFIVYTSLCVGQMAAVDEGQFNYMPTDYSIIAPPPEVAALIEHNEIGVSYNTGLPDITC